MSSKIYYRKNFMTDLKREIALRLREVRKIYNGGYEIRVEDFAKELDERNYNILNYEAGKANIPARLLVALYHKGFNPTYILTGEGSKFANNTIGRILSMKIEEEYSEKIPGNVAEIYSIDISKLSDDELMQRLALHTAAAGDITKMLQEKKRKKKKKK